MPELKTRELYDEFGASGITRWGAKGIAQSMRQEALRELRGVRGLKLFREMRLNNPVIAAVFHAMEWTMRAMSFPVERVSDSPEDQEAGDYLESCFGDMSFSFDATLSFILDMWVQGFSILEIVYKKRLGQEPPKYTEDPAKSKYNDGLIGWRKWAPRPADSLSPGGEWQLDEAGGVQGIYQDIPGEKTSKFIPIEKLLLFRTTAAPRNNPRGRSLLRSMYWPHYFAKNIMEVEGIGIERDLAGLPVIYLGEGTSKGPGANTDYSKAKSLVVNIRRDEQEGIVIPHQKMNTEGVGMLVELLTTGGRRQFDTNQIVDRYNRLTAMTLLAQFLFLGMEQAGSYSLGVTHADLFSLMLTGWGRSICDVINRHAVPRLFALNPKFAGLEELPQLGYTQAGTPDLAGISEYVNKLVGANVLTYDQGIERHLRELAGFPEMIEEEEVTEKGDVRDAVLDAQRIATTATKLLELGSITPEQSNVMMGHAVSRLGAMGLLEKSWDPLEDPESEWEITEADIELARRTFGERVK